jgi:integrase
VLWDTVSSPAISSNDRWDGNSPSTDRPRTVAPKHGPERTIVVPDRLLTLIAGHVEQHLPIGGPERRLFPTPTGIPPHQNTVGHRWRETMSATGVTGLRLHDLRHFFASRAHRLRLRRGDRAAGTGPRLGDHDPDPDPEHLRAPVARRRGPRESRHGRLDGRLARQSCGPSADRTTSVGG